MTIDVPRFSPVQLEFCGHVLDSFGALLGRDLVERASDREVEVNRMFEHPAMIAAHGVEVDPIFKFGNRVALELFELSWDELLVTPSRRSAEPDNRPERAEMLARAERDGYIDDYSGVRVSSSGKRFRIRDAIIWNVSDRAGHRVGQAATFDRWTFL